MRSVGTLRAIDRAFSVPTRPQTSFAGPTWAVTYFLYLWIRLDPIAIPRIGTGSNHMEPHRNTVIHSLLSRIPWPAFDALVGEHGSDKLGRPLLTGVRIMDAHAFVTPGVVAISCRIRRLCLALSHNDASPTKPARRAVICSASMSRRYSCGSYDGPRSTTQCMRVSNEITPTSGALVLFKVGGLKTKFSCPSGPCRPTAKHW